MTCLEDYLVLKDYTIIKDNLNHYEKKARETEHEVRK
jgi:hypothetical protein